MKLLIMYVPHHTVTPYLSDPHTIRCILPSDNLSLITFYINLNRVAVVTMHYVAKGCRYNVREEMEPEIASSRFLYIRPTLPFNKTKLNTLLLSHYPLYICSASAHKNNECHYTSAETRGNIFKRIKPNARNLVLKT
jgi:hypothetical protein